ncbi:MAG: P-II family nitrogen regulator [Ruminococcaceae bacterium]|nr:P-II family nitrogen regulator [Oscillospiraceae bacterium]
MQNLYWFITISKRSDDDAVIALYQDLEIPRVYSCLANGTAKSQILDLLGLEFCEKTVHQTVITHNKLYELIDALERRLHIDLPGQGIALAIPLTSISTKKSLDFFAGGHAEDEMKEKENVNPRQMELIIAICNKGYTEDVMDQARAAGAGGGTVLHAKGTAGTEYAEKFFGLSLVDEKEIIYIVSKKDKRNAIMHAISTGAGPGTKAHALVFSLPISDTAGFRFYDDSAPIHPKGDFVK